MNIINKKITVFFALLFMLFCSCKEIVPFVFSPTLSGETEYTNLSKLVVNWEAVANATSYSYKIGEEGEWLSTTETTITVDAPASGIYKVFVKAQYQSEDGSVRESQVSMYTVVVDKEAPESPSITVPAFTNESRPTWSWSRPENADRFKYSLDGGEWQVVSIAETSFRPLESLTVGTHTLELAAGDRAGNWSAVVSDSVEVDLDAPDVPVVAVDSTVGSTVLWTWPPVEGVDEYRYQLDFEYEDRWVVVPGNVRSYTNRVGTMENPDPQDFDLTDGDHILYVQARDVLGNWSASGSAIATVDTVGPDSPVISGRSSISNLTPTWSWSVPADTARFGYKTEVSGQYILVESTITSHSITVGDSSGNFANGDYTFYLVAIDANGNMSDEVQFTTTVNTDALECPVVAVANAVKAGDEYRSANVFPYWEWSMQNGVTPAAYRYSFNEVDWIERISEKNFLDFNGNAQSEGLYTLYVQAQSAEGGWSASGSASLTIDLTGPVISSVFGSPTTGDTRPVWGWSPEDVNDIVQYRYRLNSGSNIGDWMVPEDDPGTPANEAVATSYKVECDLTGSSGAGTPYILEVQGMDLVGNWSESVTFTTSISTSTPEAPVVSCSEGTTTNNPLPTWTWTVPAGVSAARYQLDSQSGAWTTVAIDVVSYTPSAPVETSGSSNSHTLYVQVQSASNGMWSGSGFESVLVDLKAPNAPVVYGDAVSGLARPVISWIPEDSLDASAYAYKFNDDTGAVGNPVDNWAVVDSSTQSASPAVDLPDGDNVLYVRTRDSVGNWSISGSHTINLNTVALAPPTVEFAGTAISVDGIDYTTTRVPNFNWTDTSGGAVEAFRYRFNGSSWTTVSGVTPATVFPKFDLSDGLATCEVQVQNSVGNWSASGEASITVLASAPAAPIVTSISPETSDTTPRWFWSHSDPAVTTFKYRIDSNPFSEEVSITDYAPATALLEGAHVMEVQAKDAVGNWSVSGSYTVIVNDTAVNYGVPQPIIIKSVSKGAFSQGVRIEWLDDSEAESYTIHRLTQADVDGGAVFGTLLVADLSRSDAIAESGPNDSGDSTNMYYYDTSVNPGDVYYYRIKGKNPDGEGKLSLLKIAEYRGVALGGYSTSVTVLVRSTGYRVSWPECAGSAGYYIYRSASDPSAYSAADWGDPIAYTEALAYLDGDSGADLERDTMWYRVLPADSSLVGGGANLIPSLKATVYASEIALIGGYDPTIGYSDYSQSGSDFTVPIPELQSFAASDGSESFLDTINVVGQLVQPLAGDKLDLNELKVTLKRICYYGEESDVHPLWQPNRNESSERITYSKVGQPLYPNIVNYELSVNPDGSFSWVDPMPDFAEDGSVLSTGMKWDYKHWDREAWRHILRQQYVDTTKMVDVYYVLSVDRICEPGWGYVEFTAQEDKGHPALSNVYAGQMAMWLKDIALNSIWHLHIPRYCWSKTQQWLTNQNTPGQISGSMQFNKVGMASGNGKSSGDYADFPGHIVHINYFAMDVDIVNPDGPKRMQLSGDVDTPYYKVTWDFDIQVDAYGVRWGLWPGSGGTVGVAYEDKTSGVVRPRDPVSAPLIYITERDYVIGAPWQDETNANVHGYTWKDTKWFGDSSRNSVHPTAAQNHSWNDLFTRINFKYQPVPGTADDSPWDHAGEEHWNMNYTMNDWPANWRNP